MSDEAFQDWVERAKAAPIKDVAEQLGARLKRASGEFVGPCPRCGGDDRFQVNPKKGVFLCRPSGEGGGSVDMVLHVNGGDFLSACEFINGEPPPKGESRAPDHDSMRERERERREADRARDEQHAQEQAKKRSLAEEWWDTSVPIEGTPALAYLRARGLDPQPAQTIDLGFIASAPLYSGDTDEAGKLIKIGNFPCMIAAIRNVAGAIIGAHRTYLDPDKPRKLILPDGQKAGKKIIGEVMGGAIWLGEPKATTAIAEGVETALAFGQLWTGGEIALCAAVSLGNLSGGSTGTRPHPRIQKRTIPNGLPDLSRPGIRLPPIVREAMILGDGDSDPATTRAHLLTAGRRFRAEGLAALVSMAPEGCDWNDALIAQPAKEMAA